SGLAADHPPVVAAQGDGSQRPLAEVVVDGQIPLLQVAPQRLPVVQRITDGLTQRRLRQRLGSLRVQPLLQLDQDRLGLPLPPVPPLLFPLTAFFNRHRIVRR